ncbi:hypothetical protein [Algirhabdus cladophorae]|uniref:hypothetical protein n=1 Tax=Algirhabdus cladophorae TaxID=3377108 RepID=UPI003B845D2D
MDALILVSLLVNVLVAGALPFALLNGTSMDPAYGADSPARRILACLYGAIAAASIIALLSVVILDKKDWLLGITAILLPFQCLYKLATWPAVGLHNPVVKANLAIAALHLVTLGACADILYG